MIVFVRVPTFPKEILHPNPGRNALSTIVPKLTQTSSIRCENPTYVEKGTESGKRRSQYTKDRGTSPFSSSAFPPRCMYTPLWRAPLSNRASYPNERPAICRKCRESQQIFDKASVINHLKSRYGNLLVRQWMNRSRWTTTFVLARCPFIEE